MNMKMIPEAGTETLRADRVHQEEGRVREVSVHQKAVRAEGLIILLGRVTVAAAKEDSHPEMMM